MNDGPPHLEFVGDHVPQALVVHWADIDVSRELLPCDSTDQALPCKQT